MDDKVEQVNVDVSTPQAGQAQQEREEPRSVPRTEKADPATADKLDKAEHPQPEK